MCDVRHGEWSLGQPEQDVIPPQLEALAGDYWRDKTSLQAHES